MNYVGKLPLFTYYSLNRQLNKVSKPIFIMSYLYSESRTYFSFKVMVECLPNKTLTI